MSPRAGPGDFFSIQFVQKKIHGLALQSAMKCRYNSLTKDAKL